MPANGIFPEDYLKALREKGWSVEFYAKKALGGAEVRAYATRESESFDIFNFSIFTRRSKDEIQIEGLAAQDPLSLDSAARAPRHAGQRARGLPYAVFKHAALRILSTLHSQGFTTLVHDTPQNYLVASLYQRLFGSHAQRSKKSTDFFLRLGNAYKQASSFPEPFRVGSLDAFSRLLGDVNRLTYTTGFYPGTIDRLIREFELGMVTKESLGADEINAYGLHLFTREDGKLLAAGFLKDGRSKPLKAPVLVFFDQPPGAENPKALQWSRLVSEESELLEIRVPLKLDP